jgi:hypothetical protein
MRTLLFGGLIAGMLFPYSSVAQDTIRVTTALTIVEVITQDPKNGLPVLDLKKEDFRITDNGKEVPISTFDTGAHYGTQPVVIWFVVLCNERGKVGGSAEFFGRINLFRPALDHLDKTDTVGVAHWCDNGETKLDLLPTNDRDKAIEVLSQAIKPIKFMGGGDANRVGEVTYRKMVRLIIQDAQNRNPRPLPVIVFLDGDRTGQPLGELNQVVNDLLETSGIVFGIKDKIVPDMSPLVNGEQEQISHYMAYKTGGQYFAVFPDNYATALDMIFIQLHFRYDLGFRPPALDGKRHRLDVELTGQAKADHKGIRLSYRGEYIPVSEKPSWLQ